MSRARYVLRDEIRLQIRRARPLLVLLLVILSLPLVSSLVSAAQLNLIWNDNSGGQAGFVIQRATGTTGMYSQIAQTPSGVGSYADTTASLGVTYCYQVAAFNNAGLSSFSIPACGSPAGGFALTVAKAGTAGGTIGSSPDGIKCGTLCSATFPNATVLTLTATPSVGSVFGGWSGGGCSGTDPCTMVGNVPVTVTATFAGILAPTAVTTDGPASSSKSNVSFHILTVRARGAGTVSNNPGGVSCSSVCATKYANGSVVTLTALPGPGAQFNGWDGAGCRGTGTCTLTLRANIVVSAVFRKGGQK